MFKNLTKKQLKKRQKLCLGIALFMLLLMIIVLTIALRQISQGTNDDMLIFIVPTILGPLTLVPIIISSLLSSELKKRN